MNRQEIVDKLKPISVVRDGKWFLRDGEDEIEATPDVLRAILPPKMVPAQGVGGSGGRPPRPYRGASAEPRDIVAEGMLSQSAYNKNRDAIIAELKRRELAGRR